MMPDPPLLDESAPIEQAVALMQAHGLDTLPVVGEGRFVGTIRMVDCCQALLEVNRGESMNESDDRADD
jgi:CBS domain-containing protein